jgi:hypothetical protein
VNDEEPEVLQSKQPDLRDVPLEELGRPDPMSRFQSSI